MTRLLRTWMPRLLRRLTAALVLGCPLGLSAGEFAVYPLRLEIGGAVRSGAITLRNDDKVALSFKVRGMNWTQDEEGNDLYEDATDLIYFPRLLRIEPGQEAVVRVGTRPGSVAVEKAYRLFIEEQPQISGTSMGGPKIRVLVRFGAPLFVVPAKPVLQLELDQLELADGQVRWALRNAGNRHELFQTLRIQGLDAGGAEVFAHQLTERYFLAGKTRRFTAQVPADQCAKLTRVALEVRTDKSEIRREIDLGKPSCK